MERRYFFASTVGRSEVVLERIKTVVLSSDMASRVPIVKWERRDRRARGEFFVFIGVDCEDVFRIPHALAQSLRTVGLRFDERYPLKPDAIASMVQHQGMEIHVFESLQRRTWAVHDAGDPFEQAGIPRQRGVSSEACACFDLLLRWISARGEGTWETFGAAVQILGLSNSREEARSALRRLGQLGHIELSGDGSRWSISPAAFVRFADDPSHGYLVGPRTDRLLGRIADRWELRHVHQRSLAGPARIDLDSGIVQQTEGAVALGITDAGTTSTRLANLLPVLDGWKDSLLQVTVSSIGTYVVEKWEAGEFEVCDSVYERGGEYFGESGMYRFRREGDSSNRTRTLFFDQPTQRWLRGDWYGLHFLVIKSKGLNDVMAVHDSNSEELVVRVSQRWPLLYERALTLASGLLPGTAANDDCLRYPRIPLQIAQTLCEKLGVALHER